MILGAKKLRVRRTPAARWWPLRRTSTVAQDDERTDAEVRALRSANVRVRVLAGKEDRDAKAALRTTERKIPQGSKDEPYFAVNYLRQVKSSQELLPGIHEIFLEPATERGKARQQPQVSRSVLCVVRSCFSD